MQSKINHKAIINTKSKKVFKIIQRKKTNNQAQLCQSHDTEQRNRGNYTIQNFQFPEKCLVPKNQKTKKCRSVIKILGSCKIPTPLSILSDNRVVKVITNWFVFGMVYGKITSSQKWRIFLDVILQSTGAFIPNQL